MADWRGQTKQDHTRAIVPAGRTLPLFSPRMTGPELRSLLLSCAFLTTRKDCSWSWHRYDLLLLQKGETKEAGMCERQTPPFAGGNVRTGGRGRSKMRQRVFRSAH